MRESPDDVDALQRGLDASFQEGGAHLLSIFEPDARVTATELLAKLDGVFEMHLAVVTAGGQPLVAPIDGILFQGKVWFGLPSGSVRSPLVKRNPNVSASYTDGSFALIVHGVAHEITDDDSPLAVAYEDLVKELYVALCGPGWLDFYEYRKREFDQSAGFTGWIEPRRIFAKR